MGHFGGQKWPKNGLFWAIWGPPKGPRTPKMGYFGLFWAILGHFEPSWTVQALYLHLRPPKYRASEALLGPFGAPEGPKRAIWGLGPPGKYPESALNWAIWAILAQMAQKGVKIAQNSPFWGSWDPWEAPKWPKKGSKRGPNGTKMGHFLDPKKCHFEGKSYDFWGQKMVIF